MNFLVNFAKKYFISSYNKILHLLNFNNFQTVSGNSRNDGSMRYHLATQHTDNELLKNQKIILYPSLLDRFNRLKSTKKRSLTPELKT